MERMKNEKDEKRKMKNGKNEKKGK